MNRSSPYHPLKWRVDVRHPPQGGWETMAAFNVDSVALRYAQQCRDVNLHSAYRVMERAGRGWREVKEAAR